MIRRLARMMGFAGLVAAPLAAADSAPAPMVAPGGVLDGRFTGAEVYLTDPERAKRPPGKACAVAEAYVDRVNAGRFRDVADLFAEDALLLEPTRTTYRGLTAIRSFYEGRIGAMKPQIVPVAYVGDDRDCMVELAVKTEVGGERRFALVSIDHFTLDAKGKVARMIAFARPPRTQ
jgi:hypothetical protein